MQGDMSGDGICLLLVSDEFDVFFCFFVECCYFCSSSFVIFAGRLTPCCPVPVTSLVGG